MRSMTYEEASRWYESFSARDMVILELDTSPNEHSPGQISVRITRRSGMLSKDTLATNVALPVSDNSADAVICLGGVINRCDLTVAIAEFERVIRPGGYLLLDFESSRSAEFAGQKAFGRSAAMVEGTNQRAEAVWVYSPSFIDSLLRAIKFHVVRRAAIGAFSSWALRFSVGTRLLLVSRRLDSMVKNLPGLTRWASSYFVVCQKSI